MLDFRIHTFLAVCRHMNFTRAAEELHITQPGVSRHIHQLEEAYGVRLFAYEGKKAVLTEAGRLLLEAAQTVKHDDAFLREQLARLGDGHRRLRFGATLTVGAYVMPAACRGLSQAASRREGADGGGQHQGAAGSAWTAGKLDFAVVEGFFDKTSYDHLRYASEPFVAVCAPGYPLPPEAKRLADLLGERLITREPGSGTRTILEKHLELQNLTLGDFRQVMEISSLEALKSLAMEGCGVTFLYQAAVRCELADGRLREIELEDFPLPPRFHLPLAEKQRLPRLVSPPVPRAGRCGSGAVNAKRSAAAPAGRFSYPDAGNPKKLSRWENSGRPIRFISRREGEPMDTVQQTVDTYADMLFRDGLAASGAKGRGGGRGAGGSAAVYSAPVL